MTVPAPTNEIHAAFAGPIDQITVQRLFHNFGLAMTNGIRHVHLLFQSNGGTVADGVCLYNFFRALPIDVTIYNVGSVMSAGVIAYLGAKHRKASAHATFMVHRTQAPAYAATAVRLHALAHNIVIDDERTEAILKQHVSLSEAQWGVHKVADLWLSAQEALECKLVDEISEFAPPLGNQVFIVSPPA